MEEEWERLGHLTPEKKVQLAIDMIDGCMHVCADGIRQQFPVITEEELIEKLRARIQWAKENP